MARRYDSRTTIFSPEGRLYQVEYAMEAINHAGTVIGIKADDGIVLIAEKKVTSKLLEQSVSSEKIYILNDNVVAGVAGYTADANSLISYARRAALSYTQTYNTSIPVEQLVQRMCDLKQGYTQYGGLRPFGVSFLYAGWDEYWGFQLYQSDPSGNYSGWKAHVIGNNNGAAQSLLKQDYLPDLDLDEKKSDPPATAEAPAESSTTTTPSPMVDPKEAPTGGSVGSKTDDVQGAKKDGITIQEAIALAVKVLSKVMDSTTLGSDKFEFSTITLDKQGRPKIQVYTASQIETLLKEQGLLKKPEDDAAMQT